MIPECKTKLPLPDLWAGLGLPEPEKVRPGGSVRSPFREERTPSLGFKQFPDGAWYWEDYGSGGELKGDEVSLIECARNVGNKEAIAIYHDMAGVPMPGGDGSEKRSRTLAPRKKSGARGANRAPVAKKAAVAAGGAAPAVALVDVSGGALLGDGLEAAAGDDVLSVRGHEVVRVYSYRDGAGVIRHQTIRYAPKTFRQRRPFYVGEDAGVVDEVNGWVNSLAGVELFPYRLNDWLAVEPGPEVPLFLCEGEKDADEVAGLGLLSSTLPMGAGKWRAEYGQWFEDRWVVLVIDADAAGMDGARSIGRELVGLGCRVGFLTMDALWGKGKVVPKSDISDWIGAMSGLDQSVEVMAGALLSAAQSAVTPVDVLYGEDYYLTGERGGVTILEDVLADRLVADKGLLMAGSDWWQWRRPGSPMAGSWRKLGGDLQISRWIREVLRSNDETVPAITDRALRSVSSVMASSNFCHPDEFNRHDRYWLNCKSGMLHAMTGELRPHDPKYMSTSQVPLEWDPEARCDRWLEWLEQMQPDPEVRAQIQEMFGYCLVPAINYHVFFFLFGEGGTGKSTCTEVMISLVGEENHVALQLEELDNGFTRSQLVGKQLYLCGELTRKSFQHIGLIKQIAAGEPIYVDNKYKAGYSFRPQGRFVMTSNVPAATPDTSGGFERRFFQINWDKVVAREDQDMELADKLRAELPGIFVWALEGFRRLKKRGRFAHTAASKEATKELMRHRSSVKEFLHDPNWLVDHGAGADSSVVPGLGVKQLYAHYQEWCEFYGVNAYFDTENTFGKEALKRYPNMSTRRVRRQFAGERQVGYVGFERKWPEGWRGKEDMEEINSAESW